MLGSFVLGCAIKNSEYQKIYNQSAPELSWNTAAEHDTVSANMFDNLCEYNEREGGGLSLEELHMERNIQGSRPSRQNLGITEEGKLVYSGNWKGIAEADLMFK